MEDLSPDELKLEFSKKVNNMVSEIADFAYFRYNFLIYKLVKRGLVKVTDLAEATGLSRERIYKIISKFDEKL